MHGAGISIYVVARTGKDMTANVSPRTRLQRLPDRGSYDREALYRLLDEAFICHVGFTGDSGPVVIPTAYGRDGDRLVIHGSAASRMMRSLQKGVPVCVAVTLVDALVLARSAFHHSINYRSAVIFGTATLVEDPSDKDRALEKFVEHIVRGRWADVRKPTAQELKATTVLTLPLEEFSVKSRSGPAKDDEEDHALPVWAGLLPLPVTPGAAEADPLLPAGIPVPEYVNTYSRRR